MAAHVCIKEPQCEESIKAEARRRAAVSIEAEDRQCRCGVCFATLYLLHIAEVRSERKLPEVAR